MLVVCELAATCPIDKTVCKHHKVAHPEDGEPQSCHGVCQLRDQLFHESIWCACVPVHTLRTAKLKEMGIC